MIRDRKYRYSAVFLPVTTESSFCGKKEKGNAGEWDEKYRKEREDFPTRKDGFRAQ